MRRATSIRSKLVLLLAIPLVVLVVVAALGVRWTSDAAARSRATIGGAEVATVSNRAALEVARERGLAAAVLANPGNGSFASELRFQRGQTDVELDRLAATLAEAGHTDEPVVDDVVAGLDEARAATDAGLVTVDDALTAYSALLDGLLATGAAGVAVIDDADLRGTAASYAALTHMTDAIALQQSLLVSAYAAGRIDAGVRDRAVAAAALEDTWEEQFTQGSTRSTRAAYDDARESPSVAAADRLRAEVMAVPPGGPLPDDGDLWLSSTSRKVDLLAALADEIGADIRDAAEDRGAAASRSRTLLLVLGAAALALIAVLVMLLNRLVVRPIRQLTDAAHVVARDVLPRAVEVAHSRGSDAAAAEDVAVPLVAPSRDELGELTEAFNAVQRTAVGLAAEQATLRRNVGEVFVNLGRRTQNLITRQIDQIDHLEERTDEPDTLADLFLLDHLATRLRRNAENMLVLAGAESPRPWARPVSIANVVRAALAESTDYSRVDLVRVEPAAVLGAAVSDVSHLLAELVDNALAFSPPTERVVVSGQHMSQGRYGVVVEDAGIGMSPDRLAQANARIAAPPVDDFAVSRFLGLYVVGRLAGRHGVAVHLAASRFGGVAAHVLLPARVMAGGGDLPIPPAGAGAAAVGPGRSAAGDPGGTGRLPPTPSPAYNPAPAPVRLAARTGDG